MSLAPPVHPSLIFLTVQFKLRFWFDLNLKLTKISLLVQFTHSKAFARQDPP